MEQPTSVVNNGRTLITDVRQKLDRTPEVISLLSEKLVIFVMALYHAIDNIRLSTRWLCRKKSIWQANYVSLNVGGQVFTEPRSLLTKFNTRIGDMLNDENEEGVILEENGFIFIDRDYNRFERILRFMRKPVGASLPGDLYGLRELLVEAKYFGFEELIAACQIKIAMLEETSVDVDIRVVYDDLELERLFRSGEPAVVFEFSDTIAFKEAEAAMFTAAWHMFGRSRRMFPAVRFVLDLSPRRTDYFGFKFLSNGECISELDLFELNPCSYDQLKMAFIEQLARVACQLHGAAAKPADAVSTSPVV